MEDNKKIQRRLILRRNRRYNDWKTFSVEEKGNSRDYIKMVEIEDILAELFGYDRITLIESRNVEDVV